jgi:hypothetical protein
VLRNGAPDCPVCHQTVSGAPSYSVQCTGTVQLKPATLGFLRACSAIIHRTVWCASGATATQRNGRLQKALIAQTVRARSQSRSQRRTRQCSVWHQTVRCRKRTKPPTVDCSQTLKVGWRGGSPDSLQDLSGGAPNCPVRPSTGAFPNGLLVVEGYKYPQPPQLQASKSSDVFIQYKS